MKMNFSTVTPAQDKEDFESPSGIEPMASQIPVGRSNQLSYVKVITLANHKGHRQSSEPIKT